MAFRINGTEIKIRNGLTINAFLSERSINPDVVVIEYNGEILNKNLFDTTQIKDGDNIEVLSFVGGG
jgi:sulfur carrier protein